MTFAKFLLILTTWVPFASARAGDAVAFDYATALGGLYYSSSSEDGSDYRDAKDAREPALTMARRTGAQAPLVIHQSDLTGFFCLAVACDEKGRFVAHVGQGESAVNAKADAFRGLTALGAMTKPDVIYEYFSYGARTQPPKLVN